MFFYTELSVFTLRKPLYGLTLQRFGINNTKVITSLMRV